MTRFQVVAIAGGLLLAISGASFAAHPKAKESRGVVTAPNGSSRIPAFDPKGTSAHPFGPGINFPYPDRPYGDPSRW
jgi:hypothetical protein